MPTKRQIANFEPKAIWAMSMLLRDFPEWTILDAAADLGNAGHESAGMTALQEIKPTIPGSRGGFGWYQWTGPRRVKFEAYCTRNSYDPRSDIANYKFHFLELRGEENMTLVASRQVSGLRAKVIAFENAYERSGIKNYESRIAWAEIAHAAYLRAYRNGTLPDIGETGKENAMDDIKNFLASKTIWGIVIMLAPLIARATGLDFSNENVEGLQSLLDEGLQLVGAAIALFGRITARSKIKLG